MYSVWLVRRTSPRHARRSQRWIGDATVYAVELYVVVGYMASRYLT